MWNFLRKPTCPRPVEHLGWRDDQDRYIQARRKDRLVWNFLHRPSIPRHAMHRRWSDDQFHFQCSSAWILFGDELLENSFSRIWLEMIHQWPPEIFLPHLGLYDGNIKKRRTNRLIWNFLRKPTCPRSAE